MSDQPNDSGKSGDAELSATSNVETATSFAAQIKEQIKEYSAQSKISTSAMAKIRAVRAVRDILPPETALWNRVEQTARDVFRAYGYGEIRLPIFELAELFARAVGSETDIVSKEMYTFEDRGISLPDKSDYEGVVRFVERVSDAFAKGEIPNNKENASRIGSLKEKFGELVEQSRQLTSGFSQVDFGKLQADIDKLNDLWVECLGLCYTIQLGDNLSLRPEATASVARAYIEHGMHTLPGDVKLYYIGPMFRRERPQKGRYRQFYQIGAEVLGQSDAPAVDAEVIEMLMDYFARLRLEGATLYLNSIGCADCRPKYVETLRAALRAVKDKLGADSQRRIETNPLRVLDSKLESEQAVIEALPRIAEHLCESCRAHFAALKDELRLRGVAFEENWRLVRGLDYYTRTTFEITARGLGSQNAVCGGGRYDGLVEMLGGPPTKGIGFAIGLDRLILSLQEQGKGEAASGPDVFIAWMGREAWPASVKLARTLRDAGVSVGLPPEERNFKKTMKRVNKLGARYALIIGEDEVASRQFTLKRLADGEQKKFAVEDLIAHLRTELHPA